MFAELPVYEGMYYCEITVLDPKLPLPSENLTSHVRLGIATKSTNVELPIGTESLSLSYRDRDGSLMNSGKTYNYGSSYSAGDVIGILIHMRPPKPKLKGL